MSSRSGTLPGHLRDGRTSFSGPCQGGYFPIVVNIESLASTDTRAYTFLAPMDMRLEEVMVNRDTGTGNTTCRVRHDGTDVVASAVVPAVDVATAQTLVAATRNVADGEEIEVLLTGVTNTSTAMSVLLTYYTRGHVYADEAND